MNPLIGLERWFGWLLQTTWQAAVLAALVLLAQFLLRNRLSPGWRYGLWFLLLLRLVMPMAPSSAVSIFNLAKWSPARATHAPAAMPAPARADMPAATRAARPQADPGQPSPAPRMRQTVPQVATDAPLRAARPAVAAPQPAKALDWLEIASLVWLAGALTLAARFVWANHRFRRRLAGYPPVRDPAFEELFKECTKSLGVRQRVTVIETEEVESPAVYGLWRKRLLLPEGLREELTPGELRHVLQHELAHLKRRDPELNCLVAALHTLHWFNPVLWFAFARMRADRELATDELALAHTQQRERDAYGETIIKVLEGLTQRPALAGLVGIGESKAQIGERIRAIARGSTRPGWRWAAGALAVALAGIALTSAQEERRAKGVDLLHAVDTNCASVVSVAPANGAQNVGLEQELRIRFDRPMNPYTFKLEWMAGGFQPNGSIQVGADRKEFIIPVRLMPGQEQTIAVNWDPEREMTARRHKPGKPEPSPFARGGFKDANGETANEFRWSFTTKELPAKADAPKPRMVAASPASGSTTPVLTFIELTFDQPMRPPELGFPYQDKRPFMEGPSPIPSFDYDAKARRFTFPALLRVEDDVRLTLRGFYSAEGVACDPVVLHYQTGTEELDPQYVARSKAAAKDPKLQKLLAAMKEARTRLTSGTEIVQTIHLGMNSNAFNSLEAQTATFKWQGGQVYADISGPMMMSGAFILGSDGQNCWLYSEDEKGKKRLDQTPCAVTKQQVDIVNPFDIANRSVEEVLKQGDLVLGSDATLEGRRCYRVEQWEVSLENFVSASQMQWWIDAETSLPRQMASYSGNWCQIVRFDYKDLNQPLPASAFKPPVAPGDDTHALFFDKEPAPGERRFLRISDGSDGRMSGRLGYHSSGGTTSSGMN